MYPTVTNIYRNSILDKIKMRREIVRAKGCYLYDSEGNEIVDCLAQYGAVPFGHNPDFILDSIMSYFSQCGPGFVQPFVAQKTEHLSRRLCQLAGPEYSYVVFTSTGAETVEAAIKLARLSTGREKVLSTENSFHGKTFSSLSATGSDKYANRLIVDTANYSKVAFNDEDALENALATRAYAAFLVEPVQGEGGMIEADPEYLKTAQTLCRKYGTAFIADEIQTGIGRTGYMIASQKYDIKPDMILLSKALGGGVYPIGSVIVKKRFYSREFDKKHSSTFANGGLGAQIASAVLDRFDCSDKLLECIRSHEVRIKNRLDSISARYPSVFSYTGTGLMYALRFKDDHSFNNYIISFCQNRDVLSYIVCGYLLEVKNCLCMPFLGDAYGAIRFEPALTMTVDAIESFLDVIEEVTQLIANRRYDILMSYLVGRKLPELDVSALLGYVAPRDDLWADFPYSENKRKRRFAFLMHSTNVADVVRALPIAVKEHFNADEQNTLAEWVMEFGAIDPTPERTIHITMKSRQGELVEGILVYSPMRPEDMMKLSADEKKQLINDFLDVAEREQVDVVGLGAFTSVISRAGADIQRNGFRLTTGNSFTAMSTAESIRSYLGADITSKRLMVIGARGSVGRLAFMDLSTHFKEVFLVGSPRSGVKALYDVIATSLVELHDADVKAEPGSALSRFKTLVHLMDVSAESALERLRSDGAEYLHKIISKGEAVGLPFPFEVSVDINDFISRSDCVISVTSEGKPFIKSNIFMPGTVVFDTARPFDVICSESEDEIGVRVYEGGLVRQPEDVLFGDCNMIGSRAGINLACLSETIALTMEGVDRNYSVGPNIPYSEAREVFEIATRHGFRHYLDDRSPKMSFEREAAEDLVTIKRAGHGRG